MMHRSISSCSLSLIGHDDLFMIDRRISSFAVLTWKLIYCRDDNNKTRTIKERNKSEGLKQFLKNCLLSYRSKLKPRLLPPSINILISFAPSSINFSSAFCAFSLAPDCYRFVATSVLFQWIALNSLFALR